MIVLILTVFTPNSINEYKTDFSTLEECVAAAEANPSEDVIAVCVDSKTNKLLYMK